MQIDELTGRVREFIVENFLFTRPDYQLGDDDRLLGTGVLDSMGVLELITFLGEEFRLEIADDEITEANLGTLRSIAGYVASKLSAGERDALHRAGVD